MDNPVLIDNHAGTGKANAIREYFAQLSAAENLRAELATEREDNAAYRRILAYIIGRRGVIAIPREVLDGEDAPEIELRGTNICGDVLLGVRR